MIELTHVTKEYAGRGKALNRLSLRLGKGEFAFLTGHSGSGKSTTLRLIHMAETPSAGEVVVCGFSSGSLAPHEVWKLRRRVSHVFQDFRLLPGRTALENVAFALEVTGAPGSEVEPRSTRLLAQVGLAAKSSLPVQELSGGERQRVAIARAMANEPLVLLADEPTGNLDERSSRGIMELFRDLNAQGVTILMATHDLELVRAYPDIRLLELSEGQLVFDSGLATSSHGQPSAGADPAPTIPHSPSAPEPKAVQESGAVQVEGS